MGTGHVPLSPHSSYSVVGLPRVLIFKPKKQMLLGIFFFSPPKSYSGIGDAYLWEELSCKVRIRDSSFCSLG